MRIKDMGELVNTPCLLLRGDVVSTPIPSQVCNEPLDSLTRPHDFKFRKPPKVKTRLSIVRMSGAPRRKRWFPLLPEKGVVNPSRFMSLKTTA